jgi:hypothetical protein
MVEGGGDRKYSSPRIRGRCAAGNVEARAGGSHSLRAGVPRGAGKGTNHRAVKGGDCDRLLANTRQDIGLRRNAPHWNLCGPRPFSVASDRLCDSERPTTNGPRLHVLPGCWLAQHGRGRNLVFRRIWRSGWRRCPAAPPRPGRGCKCSVIYGRPAGALTRSRSTNALWSRYSASGSNLMRWTTPDGIDVPSSGR